MNKERFKNLLHDPKIIEQFHIRDCKIAGDDCILVFPSEMGVDWTEDNLILRSVILRKSDYQPISWMFDKFFNCSEKLSLYPDPNSHKDWVIEEKLDGSLIGIAKYKGQLIVRTRGTEDAFIHENSDELKKLLDENPLITDNPYINHEGTTLLFEWLSVKNQIIIKHDKPKLILIGERMHDVWPNYASSVTLDHIAAMINVERPKLYSFNSIDDIINNCKILKGMEGYVLSYNFNRNRIKLKTDHYLLLHRMKSQLSSIDKVIDIYLLQNKPDFHTFYNYILTTFDFELAEFVKENLQIVCCAGNSADSILREIEEFVNSLDKNKFRKYLAKEIKDKFKSSGLDSLAFTIFDGKEIDHRKFKKLMESVMKENEMKDWEITIGDGIL